MWLRNAIRNWRRKRLADAELDEEVRGYIDLLAQEKIHNGMDEAQASREAQMELGGAEKVKEQTREVRAGHFLETLWQDLRYGARMLRKNPGFTVVAVLTLALGIGANTAIFSMVDWLMLRPLPVKDAGQLTYLVAQLKGGGYDNGFSYPNFEDIRKQSTSVFSYVAGVQPFQMDGLQADGKNLQIWTNYVTGDFFEMLGIRPALGRFILPSEGAVAGADPVLVLSYSYWQAHFDGNPNVVGKKVSINGHPVTIIGVAPKGFNGALAILDTQGYLPFGMAAANLVAKDDFLTNRSDETGMILIARLKPGMTLADAQPALNVVAQRMAEQFPKIDNWKSMRAARLTAAPPGANADPSQNPLLITAGLFLFLAGLVMLLACVNVANLLLIRGNARGREMAVRAALGAGRRRLMRQLLTESLLLALLGCAGGIVLGIAGSRLLSSINLGSAIPITLNFNFNWRVFAYAFGAALLTGIVVGFVPALRASRSNLNEVLHEGGRTSTGGRQRLRSTLVVAQVAGSLMLLIVAGLFVRSLQMVQHTDLGFDPSHILNISIDSHEAGYNTAKGEQFFHDLMGRVRALPGVQSASIAGSVPMGLYSYGSSLKIAGYEPAKGQQAPSAGYNSVTSEYFATMQIPLLQGRDFLDSDDAQSQHVAIVNEAMAKKYWPGLNPLGRQFVVDEDQKHPLEIVGVVKNSVTGSISDTIEPFFYQVFAQKFMTPATLQVRTIGASDSMTHGILGIIRTAEPAMPVFDVQTMTKALDTLNGLMIYQLGAGLAASLGILGLLLAVVGVYGVVSYAASQRTHEIGIRIALGAQREQILKMIFRQGLLIVGLGLAIGILATLGISRLVSSLLVGVAGTDPLTYAAVAILLTSVALAACYIPARRAVRVDPMTALRYE